MNTTKLKQHVTTWIGRLGSAAKVADRCGISSAALSQWMSDKYGADTNALEAKIATGLDYKETGWVVVEEIRNFKMVQFMFNQCREMKMWTAISSNAGSGKTQSLKHIAEMDHSGAVIYMQAEEWTSRQFLMELYRKVKSTTPKGYVANHVLLAEVAKELREMGNDPILVIDEVDKLKPSAMRMLIPLFNRTEDVIGCILSGTENFEKEIKAGVNRRMKGYDEIDSRLGRAYIKLEGVMEQDAKLICEANGVTDGEQVSAIWGEVDKVQKWITVKTKTGVKEVKQWFVEDVRRLKRLIVRQQLMNKTI
ncbi:MAG: AAA family ATPase [Marinifilaceae bacterium]